MTQANNKAASATRGKRKLSSRKASGSQPRRAWKARHRGEPNRPITPAAPGLADIQWNMEPVVAAVAQAPLPADVPPLPTGAAVAQASLPSRFAQVPPPVPTPAPPVLPPQLMPARPNCRRISAEEPLGWAPNWAAELVAELAAGRRRMAEACTAIGLTPPVQPPDTNIHRMYSAEYCRNIRQEWCAANCQEGESSCGSVGNVDQKPYFPSSLPLDHPDCHWNRVAPWNGDDDDCHWNGVATEMVLLRGCTTPQW